MRYAKYKKFTSGFTLLEVLIAITVFSILFAAFVPLIDSSIKMNRKSTQMLEDAITASSGKTAIELANKIFKETISVGELPSGFKYVHVDSTVMVGSDVVLIHWLTNPNKEEDGGSEGPQKELPVFLVQEVNGIMFYFYIPYHPFRCGADCPTCVIPIIVQGEGDGSPTTPPIDPGEDLDDPN